MTDDGDHLRLLVADGDAAFADAAADAIRKATPAVVVEAVTTDEAAIRRATGDRTLSGVVVGSALREPIDVIGRLNERTDLPVVYVTDDITDRNAVADAVGAGADDYFPRTTASAQYAVVVDAVTDRLRADDPVTDTAAEARAAEPSDRPSNRHEPFDRASRTVFENVSDGLVVHDPDTGEILDVNERFCEMNGYSRDELVGETVGVVTPPGERYSYRVAREKVRTAREDGPQLFEWRNQRADGETFPVEVHLSVVRLGGAERVLASVRDVSERKRREREFEQIFNGVNDGITVHDPDTGEIVDANETYLGIFGYDDLETVRELGIAGLSATDEGYTEDRGRAVITGVAASGEPTTVEWRVETSRCERRWLEATVAPAAIGGERRVLGIHRDITERKRREREYEQIFNGVTDIIGVYHPETAELLDVNQTMCDLLGYDRETILAADPATVTATELGFDAETIERVVREVATTDEPILDIEWALRTASGDTLWIEVNATPAEINGQRRVLTIARDVTGRRDREERVAVLNRVLRHNLRNDIDVIRAYADGIGEVADRDRVAEYTDRIRNTADGLLQLSEKARTAERILRNDENQEVKAVGSVIDSVVSAVRSREPRAAFDVTHAASDALVETEIFRLVVRELVENAAEHGGDAPSITVSTTRDDDGTTVVVADDGPGIPDRVLTPFRPGGETQRRHNHGLGLWLVNWGVRRLGGGIEFRRPADGGTTARVRLPDEGRRPGTGDR